MRFDTIANEMNAALSGRKGQTDYINVLILFLERLLVESKYGRIVDIDQFRRYRNEICEIFREYRCSTIFENDFEFTGIEAVFDLFNQSLNKIDISEIGYVFEEFYNREIDHKTGKLMVGSSRKEHGMFFSDKALVRFIVHSILSENKDFASRTFLDPSMGAGIFLSEIIEQAEKTDGIHVIDFMENNLFGVDKNPYVVDLFKISLWMKYPSIDLRKISKHIVCFDSLLTPVAGEGITWEFYFPEIFKIHKGFDFIIGNPPWGRTKANIREYNLYYNTLAEKYQGKRMKDAVFGSDTDSGWLQYKNTVSGYSKKLKSQKGFKHQSYMVNETTTGGDADLYKYFLELSFHIVKNDGMIGFIIPASFYMNEGATGLRHLLLENGSIKGLYSFENKKHIFPIHSSYKFFVMLYKKQRKWGHIEQAVFNLANPNALFEELAGLSYSIEDLVMCSGDYWSVPECRSREELNLLRKIYKFASGRPSWDMGFKRELDMTLDSEMFVLDKERENGETYLPIYEGRMITQYNCNSKKYISGNGRTAKWEKVLNSGEGIIGAHYYIKEKDAIEYGINSDYRAAYCDVTGQKNVRTVLAALIPRGAVCGNKVPTCVFAQNDLRFHLLWIGIANSFVIDWMIRKKMSITLNFFHWHQIPFPNMDIEKDDAIMICASVARILKNNNGIDVFQQLSEKIKERYLEYENFKNEELRAVIDVIVADYFGLDIYELAMILYDFQALDQKACGIPGDLRYGTGRKASYVTRDKLLKKYICMHCLPEDNIVEIYGEIGINIMEYTSSDYYSMNDRMDFYERNNVNAYSD